MSYYQITTKIKELLLSEPFTNTVVLGDIDEAVIEKQAMYPYVLFDVENVSISESSATYNLKLLAFDIVDVSKKAPKDKFIRNDNQQDVLNTQLQVLTRLYSKLKRDAEEKDYEVEGDMNCNSFNERFQDNVAGWEATFEVTLAHDMTIY